VAARFDEYLAAADKDGTPFPALLVQLLRAEWQGRQENALAARIQRAKMPESWSLESFPFKMQTGVNQRQIRSFANWSLSPRLRTSFLSAKPASAKPDLPVDCC
jgi:DNA replication protein DnaC